MRSECFRCSKLGRIDEVGLYMTDFVREWRLDKPEGEVLSIAVLLLCVSRYDAFRDVSSALLAAATSPAASCADGLPSKEFAKRARTSISALLNGDDVCFSGLTAAGLATLDTREFEGRRFVDGT